MKSGAKSPTNMMIANHVPPAGKFFKQSSFISRLESAMIDTETIDHAGNLIINMQSPN